MKKEVLSALERIDSKVTNIEYRAMYKNILVFEAVRMVASAVDGFKPALDYPARLMRVLRDETVALMRALSSRYVSVSFQHKMTLVRLVIREGIRRSRMPALLQVLQLHEDLLGVPLQHKIVSIEDQESLVNRLKEGSLEIYAEWLSVERLEHPLAEMVRAGYLTALPRRCEVVPRKVAPLQGAVDEAAAGGNSGADDAEGEREEV
jgi:hypothetical protein